MEDVTDLRRRIAELDERYPGEAFDDDARAEWEDLNERLDAEIAVRTARIADLYGAGGYTEEGATFSSYGRAAVDDRPAVVRERIALGLRTIERFSGGVLTARAADRLDTVVQRPLRADRGIPRGSRRPRVPLALREASRRPDPRA